MTLSDQDRWFLTLAARICAGSATVTDLHCKWPEAGAVTSVFTVRDCCLTTGQPSREEALEQLMEWAGRELASE